MKFNPQLKQQIEKFKDYIIIVEGKKDIQSLKSLGFQKVYALHIPSVPIKERAEQILLTATKSDKICILTDLDKKGKQLYEILKSVLQELGARLDSTLRGLLLKSKVSHIEGIPKFIEKLENIQ